MKSFLSALAVTSLLLGTAAVAQESDGGGADVSLGETIVDGRVVGEEFIKEEFQDWAHRCVVTADGSDRCTAYQLLNDEAGNSVAEISIVQLPDGGQAVAGGSIVTPLETLLTEQITIQIDANPGRRYPFSFCTRAGCLSRIGLTAEDVAAFKRGAAATVTIVPAGSPTTPVRLRMSLAGFTAAFDGL